MQISPANFLLASQQPIKQAKTAAAGGSFVSPSAAGDKGFAPLAFKKGTEKADAQPPSASAFRGTAKLGTKIDITV